MDAGAVTPDPGGPVSAANIRHLGHLSVIKPNSAAAADCVNGDCLTVSLKAVALRRAVLVGRRRRARRCRHGRQDGRQRDGHRRAADPAPSSPVPDQRTSYPFEATRSGRSWTALRDRATRRSANLIDNHYELLVEAVCSPSSRSSSGLPGASALSSRHAASKPIGITATRTHQRDAPEISCAMVPTAGGKVAAPNTPQPPDGRAMQYATSKTAAPQTTATAAELSRTSPASTATAKYAPTATRAGRRPNARHEDSTARTCPAYPSWRHEYRYVRRDHKRRARRRCCSR